jgi:tetratricopeptide (TPR) repeat protein
MKSDMAEDETQRKNILEAVTNLLKSTEELKTNFGPLASHQEDTFKILESHKDAITQMMDVLTGTEKSQRKRLRRLELRQVSVESRMSKLENEMHKRIVVDAQKSLIGPRFKKMRPVLDRMANERYSIRDLTIIDKHLKENSESEPLWELNSSYLSDLLCRESQGVSADEAANFIDKAVKKFPQNWRLWYERGVILWDNFKKSLTSYDKSISLLKSDDALGRHLVYFSKASLLIHNDKLKKALESASLSVEAKPDCINGWLLKGNIYFDMNRIREALGCAEKALSLNKKNASAWFGRGLSLLSLGPETLDEALLSLNKTIDLGRKDEAVYFARGRAYCEKKDYENALADFRRARRFDRKNECIPCMILQTLGIMGRRQEALKHYSKFLKLYSLEKCEERARVWNGYAYLLYELGKSEKDGLAFARKAVQAEPKNPAFLDTLACTLHILDKPDEALIVFSKALKLKESDEDITWEALAQLYQKVGRQSDAEDARKKIVIVQSRTKKNK